jgi:hypothetical protein
VQLQDLFRAADMRTLLSRSLQGALVFNQRKEVIRCLMVQQWGRFSSFGGLASEIVRP